MAFRGEALRLQDIQRGDLLVYKLPEMGLLHIPTTAKFLYHSGVALSLPVWRTIVLGDIGSVFDTNVASTSAVGDLPTTGSAAVAARRDHVHGREAAGTPGSSAVGDSASIGSGPDVAFNDHVHGRETFATNGIALSTAAAAGSSVHPMRADDTIAAFDTTAPVTQALGDAAATGSAAFAARRDHKHGMPSAVASSAVTFSGARSHKTATQQLSNITLTALTFPASNDYDTDSYHTGTDGKFTAPTTGYYHLIGGADWASNGTGQRLLQCRKNGTTELAGSTIRANADAFNTTEQCVDFGVHKLSATDYVELMGYQSSGGNLNVDTASQGTWFVMYRVGA